jgi:2-oxoisovalerate dehydrogenase E1 component
MAELSYKMERDLLVDYAKEIQDALCIRLVEERLLDLFKEGKLFGTVHTCIGQEFSGIAVCRSLQAQDSIFSNHRCHGHFLAYCGDLVGLIGEVMGRQIGVCSGRGGSQHLHRDNFYSNGIQGGIVPVALGLSVGHKVGETGGVSVVFIGDGTLGEGVVYEAMNIASKWELPILFVCENNLYAQSTHQNQTIAGSIVGRAEAFGVGVVHSSTWEWEQLFQDVEGSLNAVRLESRPIFHQIDTYRLMAHSKGDDDRLVDEIESYRQRDPLNYLLEAYGEDDRLQKIISDINKKIDSAVELCEGSPFAAGGTGEEEEKRNVVWNGLDSPRERVVEAVRRGLQSGLEGREDVFLLGEDIESPYGGAFKCTLGLSNLFPGRVRNTPISEAAIVGMGNGMALAGLVPVIEIMFGDFLTLVADQWINHAAKFSWMYNGKVKVPLIIRTPMGGRRGYAATHSQSIEKHFLGVPGTLVLCLHHRYSPALLYENLFGNVDRPTLVIENKMLYGQYAGGVAPGGFVLFVSDHMFPTVNIRPSQRADITLIAVGGMSIEAEQATLELFEEHEILVDLFLPTCLYPFDIEVVLPSIAITGRLLVVEEGQGFVSLSGEILAQVAECHNRQVACARLAAKPCPIPAARPLEDECLPNQEAIVAKALELFGDQ